MVFVVCNFCKSNKNYLNEHPSIKLACLICNTWTQYLEWAGILFARYFNCLIKFSGLGKEMNREVELRKSGPDGKKNYLRWRGLRALFARLLLGTFPSTQKANKTKTKNDGYSLHYLLPLYQSIPLVKSRIQRKQRAQIPKRFLTEETHQKDAHWLYGRCAVLPVNHSIGQGNLAPNKNRQLGIKIKFKNREILATVRVTRAKIAESCAQNELNSPGGVGDFSGSGNYDKYGEHDPQTNQTCLCGSKFCWKRGWPEALGGLSIEGWILVIAGRGRNHRRRAGTTNPLCSQSKPEFIGNSWRTHGTKFKMELKHPDDTVNRVHQKLNEQHETNQNGEHPPRPQSTTNVINMEPAGRWT